MGLQTVGHDWATFTWLHFTYFHFTWQFSPQFPSSPQPPLPPASDFTISGKEKSGGTLILALSIQPCCLKMCFLHSCRIQLTALCFLPAGWGSTFLQLPGACFSLSSVTGHHGSVRHPLKCLGNEYTKYFWLKQKYLLFVTRDREMAHRTLSPKTGRWVMFSAVSAYLFMTEWV